MIAGFTILLLVLLALGLPVAFALGMGGVAGMLAFMDGESALNQLPILGYKSLDDFVLTAVPMYILMSQILLTGKVGNNLFELPTNGCAIFPAAWALRRSWPVPSSQRLQALP